MHTCTAAAPSKFYHYYFTLCHISKVIIPSCLYPVLCNKLYACVYVYVCATEVTNNYYIFNNDWYIVANVWLMHHEEVNPNALREGRGIVPLRGVVCGSAGSSILCSAWNFQAAAIIVTYPKCIYSNRTVGINTNRYILLDFIFCCNATKNIFIQQWKSYMNDDIFEHFA